MTMKRTTTSKEVTRVIGRLTLWCLLFFGAALTGYSQKSKLSVARRYMQEFNYSAASEIYRDVLSNPKYANDTSALRNLSICEGNLGRHKEAEENLKSLNKLNIATRHDLHLLARVQNMQRKYGEAMDTYKLLFSRYPDDEVARHHVESPDFMEAIMRDSVIYLIRNAKGVNSAQSDFAPGFFTSGRMIFSSSRGEGTGSGRNYAWNQQPYLNVYVCDIERDTSLSNATVLPKGVNTRYHEGSMTYSPGDNRMYLTRNNHFKGNTRKAKTGYLKLGVFSYRYVADVWGDEEAFPFNDREYSVGHPSLNGSGTRLYFVSDMPGGFGGADIYYCEKEGEAWGAPKNAGPQVNTGLDEMFPFAVGDSTLYFSSRGHLGMGGLDMYYIQVLDSTATPVNLGYPANSHYDDFGVVVFPDETAGFFSSNRPGGMGDDDLYEFFIRPPATVEVSGRVVDIQTLEPIRGAKVVIEAPDGSLVSAETNEKGQYIIQAPYRRVIRLDAEKQDYVKAGIDLQTNPRKTQYKAGDIQLRKEEILAVGRVVYDADGAPAEGAVVMVLDEKGAAIDSVYVRKDGTYEINLPERSKGAVEVHKDGYVRLTKPFNTAKSNARKVENDFRLFKMEKGTVVRLDNIYYDYGKADIRPDAAIELDKLVEILNDNPTMSIELSSHTDSRGGDAYNLKLSDQRAQSAVKYIISRGIDAKRLVAKGYGETKLLNRCANNVNCSEDEHGFNRRTEFKILDF